MALPGPVVRCARTQFNQHKQNQMNTRNSHSHSPTHRLTRLTCGLLFLCSLLGLFLCSLHAQDAVTAPPSLAGADSSVQAILNALTGKYGWLVSVISAIGSIRIVFKPLMSWIESRVANDPNKSAALRTFEGGPVFSLISFLLDYTASVKLKAVVTHATVPAAGVMMLALGLLIFPLSGCGTLDKTGVYGDGAVATAPGGVAATNVNAGKVLYDADSAITTGYSLMSGFVLWEYQNRAALLVNPSIKQAADVVRANGAKWISSAIALRDTYATNSTPANLLGLQQALALITAGTSEIGKYYSPAIAASLTPPVAPVAVVSPPPAAAPAPIPPPSPAPPAVPAPKAEAGTNTLAAPALK